jgi:hypothetical protein
VYTQQMYGAQDSGAAAAAAAAAAAVGMCRHGRVRGVRKIWDGPTGSAPLHIMLCCIMLYYACRYTRHVTVCLSVMYCAD